MYKVEIINDVKQFEALRIEWDDLLERSKVNTLFLTWEWLHTWWSVFGGGSELLIITVRLESGELVAIAPLLIRKAKYYKFPVREVVFIGTGLSDRQDIIAAEDHSAALQDIFSTLYENKGRWDIARFEEIPQGGWLGVEEFTKGFRVEKEPSSTCPYVVIDGTWDSYLKSLSKKFRRDMSHKTNKMSKLGKWTLKVDERCSDANGFLDLMQKIESNSRKEGSEKEFVQVQQNQDFLKRFLTLSSDKGWFDFSTLVLNDESIAYLVGFRYNSKYYAYNMAYKDEFFQASPGKLLLHEKIKWCFDHPAEVKEFDFLRGAFYIKSLWAKEVRPHMRTVFFKRSLYSLSLRRAVFSIRPWLKKRMKKTAKGPVPTDEAE